MVKGGTNVMNDFNLGLLLSGYENGSLLCKREIQKYISVKSKIVAAEARLPPREFPVWDKDNPPDNPCKERIILEKLKKDLEREIDKIKGKWEKAQD